MYRNSNFAIIYSMKILNKKNRVGYFSKITEIFSTALTAQSAQQHINCKIQVSFYSNTWDTYMYNFEFDI